MSGSHSLLTVLKHFASFLLLWRCWSLLLWLLVVLVRLVVVVILVFVAGRGVSVVDVVVALGVIV